MKTILTFILALVFTFNIGNTFSQEDTLILNHNEFNSDTLLYDMDKTMKYVSIENLIIPNDYQFQSNNLYIKFSFLSNSENVLTDIDSLFFNNDTLVRDEVDGTFRITSIDIPAINDDTSYINFHFNKELLIDDKSKLKIEIKGYIGTVLNTYETHIITIYKGQLNIEEFNHVKVTDVNVYPNPTVNSVTIDFETDLQDIPVELYSLNGQLLEVNNDNRYFGRNSVQMEMYDYPKGMYLIKVGDEVKKIVKQ